MTKATELRDKSSDQLAEMLGKMKKEQFNLRFQKATGQLQNTSRVREVRRDIARIQTILGQQTRGEAVLRKEAASEKKAAPKKEAAKKAPKAEKPEKAEKKPAKKPAAKSGKAKK